jgi:hypothetical protein
MLFDGFHTDVMQAFQDALNVYRKLGAQIREVKMPPTLDVIDEVVVDCPDCRGRILSKSLSPNALIDTGPHRFEAISKPVQW